MAIVGTAYVEVRAVTDKVRSEVRDGFQRGMSGVGTDAGKQFEQEVLPGMEHAADKSAETLTKKLGKAGDKSGASFLDKFKLRTWRGMESLSSRFLGIWGVSGDKSGNAFGQKFWGGAQKAFSKVSFKPLMMGGLLSFLPQLVALVGQLGGGLTALSSAIGQAAGALPVMYSTMVPLVSILGSVKLGLHGVGAAFKALSTPGATQASITKALGSAAPVARQFAKELAALQPKITALRQTAGHNLLPGLTAGLKGAMGLFGPFRKMVGEIDKSVGNAARTTGQWLGGPEGLNVMHGIFNRNVVSVHNLTAGFSPLIRSFLRIYAAMQPVQNELTAMIKHGAQWLDLWTGSHGSTMADYFQRSFDRARQLGRILVNLVQTVLHVGHAASAAGGQMLGSIEKVTARWDTFTGKTATQNKMRDYFQQTIPVMHEVAGIIGDIFKGIAHLGASNKDLLPLLQQIRGQLMPALGNLFKTATGPLAHDMVSLLTDVVKVLGDLTSGGGVGFLTSFAQALDTVARALDTILRIPLIGQLAGYLLGIAGAVAAYGKVTAMLKGFTLIKWITGLGAASKTAKVEVDALSESLTAEAAAAARSAEANAAAGGGGMLGAFKGKFGRAAGLFAAGQIGASVTHGTASTIASYAGTGAAIGSFVGPEGTVAGAAIGGLVGSFKSSQNDKRATQERLDAIAKTSRGMQTLSAAEAHYQGVASKTSGMVHEVAQSMVQQIQRTMAASAAARQDAIAHERLTGNLFNEKRATDQLTASLGTHASKVMAVNTTYDNFRSQLNGLKSEVDQNGRSLRGFSNGAIANRAALNSAAQAVLDHVAALRQQGASAGTVQRALSSMSSQLRAQAIATFGSKKAVDSFLQQVGLMPGRINRALAGLRAMGLAAGGNLGSGFAQGVQQMMGATTSAAKVMADQTIKEMQYTLKERSPSKRGHDVGVNLAKGFAGGIAAGEGGARRTAERVAESSLAAMYAAVDKITTSLRTRRQALSNTIGTIGADVRNALRTSVAATNREENNMRKQLRRSMQSMQNVLHNEAHSLNNRADTLRREIADAKSAKTRAKYIAELDKVEKQRRKVLDLRDVLDRREAKALKYMRGLNDQLDKIATHRARVADRLQKAQDKLAGLREAKANIEDAVRSGISSFTNITQSVPQGLAITADRIVSNMQGRLKTVQQFAADIRTLIKRGLNKTMISEIIAEGPDVGGQYAHALASATDLNLKSLNQTQTAINKVSDSLASYVGDQFYDSGIKAAEGLIKGLKKKQSELDDVAAEMGRRMAKALKNALGIKSPSTVMRDEIGQFVPLGLAQGIDKTAPHAVAAIHRMNSKLIAASQVALSPRLAAQQAANAGPITLNSPLLAVEHLHVRDESDITKIEQMLYRAANNVKRASGQREVIPTS